MSQSQSSQSANQSNVSAELIAEALAIYTQDKAAHDRTGMAIARHQAHYEKLGVTSVLIRQMHKEAKLSADERLGLYTQEHQYRRAVSLWDAESEDDFDMAFSRAAQTEAARGEGLERLNAARAYNDGFNGGLKGGLTPSDNPHQPGTVKHAQWSKGCKDGAKQASALGLARPKAAAAPEPEPEPEPQAASPESKPKRGPGRPKRSAAAAASQESEPAEGERVALFPPSMPQ